MLSSLRITNLAIVEDLALEFKPGFSALTGETGSGKSLLVEALALLLGARADADTVRAGCERAMVEGVVEGDALAWAALLKDRGLPEEHPVVLRREVSAAGRSRAWINGAACALADLKEASRLWIRLTSQHDHQNLLEEDRHLPLLDEVLGLQPQLEAEVARVRETEGQLRARRRSEAEREARLVQLEDHLADLAKLAPKPGEWGQLRARREPLRNGAKLEAIYREAAEALREALPAAERAHRPLAAATSILPEAQTVSDRLRSLLLELEDLTALVEDGARAWSATGIREIEALEARLAAYEKAARRHRCEPDALAEVQAALQTEQQQLRGGAKSLEELEKALAVAAEAYRTKAALLHGAREEKLRGLEKEVHQRLGRLGMAGAKIQARLALAEDSGSPVLHLGRPVRVAAQGFSSLAFWLESNPGEGFRPLARIASGGELSRVMLALMGAGLQQARTVRNALTLVLDEVDAGLGGEAALAVGAAIHELGGLHQVLAITHLPQVAARAHQQGVLQKTVAEGRTRSELNWVTSEARIRELARLLAGQPDRPEALEHARALLGG
jgi:DNA repair protein RecN (Recombination protein N)